MHIILFFNSCALIILNQNNFLSLSQQIYEFKGIEIHIMSSFTCQTRTLFPLQNIKEDILKKISHKS